MKKTIAMMILSILIPVSIFAQEDDRVKMTPEEYGKLMMEGIRRGRVIFDISGTVNDTQGNPLYEVLMIVEQTRVTGFDKSIDKEEKQTINGKFHLRTNKQNSITMSFEKDGYYNVDGIYIYQRKYRKKIKNGVLEIKNLKIVMRKIGKLANLVEYDDTLKFTSDGKATVLSLKQKTDKHGDVIKYEKGENYSEDEDYEELIHVKNIFKKDALPEDCLYAVTDLDKSGKLLTKRIQPDDDSDYHYYIPETIKLKLTAEDGAFIPHATTEENTTLALRDMLKAPIKGYEKELSVNVAEYINARKMGRSEIYFYFKANGRYGKGYIDYFKYYYGDDDEEDEAKIDAMRGEGKLEVGVELYLNPKRGDRNLEFLE